MDTISRLHHKVVIDHPVGREEYLQAAETLHKSLKGTFTKDLEIQRLYLLDQVTKALGEQDARQERALAVFHQQFANQEEMVNRVCKSLEGVFEKRLSDYQAKVLEETGTALQKAFDRGKAEAMEQVKALLSSLPVTQITLPESAILVKVLQEPSVVHSVVNVPLESLKVMVDHPAVTVNVPEQKPPDVNVSFPENAIKMLPSLVNVSVPEQKPPSVSVNVPPPRRREKRISYDAHGRPETILDVDVEDVKSMDDLGEEGGD